MRTQFGHSRASAQRLGGLQLLGVNADRRQSPFSRPEPSPYVPAFVSAGAIVTNVETVKRTRLFSS